MDNPASPDVSLPAPSAPPAPDAAPGATSVPVVAPSAPPAPVSTPVPSVAPSAPPAPAATPAPSVAPSAPPAPVATPVPAVAPSASPAPVAPSIAASITNVKEQAVGAIQQSFQGGSAAVTSLVVGSAIAFFVAFVLYWVITRGANPLKKVTFQIPGTKTPTTGYDVNQINTEGTPTLKDMATISFWLYVNEFSDVTGTPVYRHVWHRGDAGWTSGPEKASPLVVLKSAKVNGVQKNSLLMSFSSSNKDNLLDGVTVPATSKIEYMVATRGIVIDYVPVKRWVHVAVTVNKKSKLMKAFVDGQLVKTMDSSKRTKIDGVSGNIGRKVTVSTLDLNGIGDIFVGGRPTSNVGLGFAGLVSNIRYSNWDMASYEVYREYKRGPVDNFMARMGLPAYGVQSPIYKML